MDKTYKIVYQSTPFAYTTPATLTVEAPSKEAAFAVAYDHLTRNGSQVDATADRMEKLKLNTDTVRGYGVPDEYGPNHILTIAEHAITAPGKVRA